mgnify:CR=1 FL=1
MLSKGLGIIMTMYDDVEKILVDEKEIKERLDDAGIALSADEVLS